MSLYYKTEFVPPDIIFAEVKEQLSSYFSAGIIDDIMFPRWTELCLLKFRKSGYRIDETILEIKDYETCLPNDFKGVREAYLCTVEHSDPIQSPSATYYQKDCRITRQDDGCGPCFENQDCCDTTFMVTHKVTNHFIYSFKRTFLLRPGNMNARSKCGQDCKNLNADTPYTFDIINNKFITNFSEGTLHLIYYAEATLDGNQLVPDNYWVQDYIRKFLVFKCFEKISNLVTDESFNQIQLKKQEAKKEQEIAFILAETELKKQTLEEKVRQVGQSYRRYGYYRFRR